MPTNKFTTSVNIIRDVNRELSYIPTPNSVRVVNQICNDFKKGVRSFNIIGSYGTGKSAFLWALQQSMNAKKKYFNVNLIQQPSFEFINIIGEYRSIKDAFAEYFEVKNNRTLTENIFSEVYNRYHDLGKKNPILFVIVDEFGKFLEYASQNEPEKELYFIQQLAEFANNPDQNIVLITTVHQNFDAYALSLSGTQKQEWTKVKGRFREITFNEPVEQLLFLASEHLNIRESVKSAEKGIQKSVDLFIKSKAFNMNIDYVQEISKKLYPLDMFSANILTLSLQRYGQNERSLFSFLESTDHTGILTHTLERDYSFYNTAHVYDYLMFNFYSYLNSRYNPDFASWQSIKSALESVETSFDKDVTNYSKLIKTIGLLNLLAITGSTLDRNLLATYAKQCMGISNAAELVEELEKKKIVLYRSYSKRFILFEGTDLDIQSALIEAGNKVSEISDVTTLLNKYYQLPPIIAKEASYKSGAPRLFEYKISEHPVNEVPQGEIDGFINLVFNDKLKQQDIVEFSSKQREAIIYGFYKNSKSIKDLLFEIEKTQKVVEENLDDKVAYRELNNILTHQKKLLNHKILNNFYSSKKEVVWVFKGEVFDISNRREFNQRLSEICRNIYNHTPIYNNELVNKHKISAVIHSAKRLYFKSLVVNWDKPQLDFPVDKFPPEKTIYLTLLENNGIKLYSDEVNHEIKPNRTNNFHYLWDASIKFMDSTKQAKRPLTDFVEVLSKRPYKLKQGLIDFWIPTFLFIRRDDFALFGENGYIPFITDEVLELIVKNPENYEVKTFDIAGVKLDIFNSYRLFLNQQSKQKISNANFIETIKPFLVFYKGLPEYSRNTKRLSKEALSIRNAISNSRDPEQTFFEEFPQALGFSMEKLQESKSDLQKYITTLQKAIRDLRTCYDDLIVRIESFIQSDIVGEKVSFEEYTEELQKRYAKLRRHLLLPDEKAFVQRMDSKIEDKKAWLNSIVQGLIGTPLDKIKDEEELIIYDKFKTMILNLDSLTSISKSDFKEDLEDVFDLQIINFIDGVSKKLIRLPKNKRQEVATIESNLRGKLSKDKTVSIAALTNLLKQLLGK